MSSFLGNSIVVWGVFGVIVLGLLALDLGVQKKGNHEVSAKKSIGLSVFYIAVGLAFSLWIYYVKGAQETQDYLTGYLIEKSLSLDNIFVISLIFGALSIPPRYQHRVLLWGILGVLILRGVMIGFGELLIHHFEWITFVFAAFLVVTGIKMLFMSESVPNVQDNALFRFLSSHMRVTPVLHREKFIVYLKDESGKKVRWVTPLLIALILIESADIVFAVDSVPAIFSITKDPYVVYTSNIFAILGLRSLYFSLSHLLSRFTYLKHSLALILIFIGTKVWAAWLFSLDKVPSSISLLVTVLLLAGGVISSLIFKHQKKM